MKTTLTLLAALVVAPSEPAVAATNKPRPNILFLNLGRHPQFSGVPMEIHEFGILNEGGERLIGDGTEFGGSWLAHMTDKIYRNDVRRVYQWDWNTDKGGDIPTPITHVMDMLEEMDGGTRLSVKVSGSSEADRLGCVAARKGERIDLMVFRHRSVRENGDKIPVRLTLNGTSAAKKNWAVTRANLIDGEPAGFFGERETDMKLVRAKGGDDAKPRSIATRLMAAHRAKYEAMSKLHSMDPLPKPTLDSSGRIILDLMMDGHSVVFLQLK